MTYEGKSKRKMPAATNAAAAAASGGIKVEKKKSKREKNAVHKYFRWKCMRTMVCTPRSNYNRRISRVFELRAYVCVLLFL